MTNAEKFRKIFKEFATEVWAFSEKDFLTWLNAEYEEPTIKNDLPHCQHTDEEIAKSFIEDVEAVKDQLPCFCEQMDFPNTFDEFAKDYGFKDKKEIYTNGSELIPVFRVRQWLEHISTTKNDLGVDCISREQALVAIRNLYPSMPRVDFNGSLRKWADKYKPYMECEDAIKQLPSVTPQEPRWIPVSEYLPVTNDEVLVTYIVNGNAKKRYVETANCFDGEWSSVNDEYRIPNTKIEIIAWCEMPKPYKAESKG